jgi:membrane protein
MRDPRSARLAGALARAWAGGKRGRGWLEQHDPGSPIGVAVGWRRRYREAGGQWLSLLLTAYAFVTLLPETLVVAAIVDRNPTAMANRLVGRLGLTGSTSSLIHGVLKGTAQHRVGSTLIANASVVLFGLGIGRVLQIAHGRAWQVELSKNWLKDQARYSAVLLALVGLVVVNIVQMKLRDGQPAWIGWAAAPLWLAGGAGLFIWAPRMLLQNRVTKRDLLPGALFTVVAIFALRMISGYLLADWLNWYAKYFGGLGVVMALFFWLLLVSSILIAAAALAPALAVRRDSRRRRVRCGGAGGRP